MVVSAIDASKGGCESYKGWPSELQRLVDSVAKQLVVVARENNYCNELLQWDQWLLRLPTGAEGGG